MPLLLFSRYVMSDSLPLHGLQHIRLFFPPWSPGICSNSCPLSQWCYLTILFLCHPLLLLPSIYPSIRITQLNSKFQFDFFIWLIKDLPYHVHLEKEMTPHSSTLAWKIPWMEGPGRLQSMGLLRVGHHWATSLSLFTFMHWRRKWQHTPVFLPGGSQGWRSLGAAIYGVTQSRTRLNHWSDLVAAVSCPLKSCLPLSFRSPHSEFYFWILDFFTSKALCSFYFPLIMGPYYWRCYVLLLIYI